MPREKQIRFPELQAPPRALGPALFVIAIVCGVIAGIWKHFG